MAKPNKFGDICKNLQFDPYVLFLVTASIFLTDQKSKRSFCAGYSKEQVMISFMQIYSVVSEETMFEQIVNNDNGHQVMAIAHMAYGQVS